MTTYNFRIFHFAEPKTVEEALNWLKGNTMNFDTLRGWVEPDNMSMKYDRLATMLNYANGIRFDGKKIRKDSKADWERRRFANARIEYFVIEETAYENGYTNTNFNFYGYRAYEKMMVVSERQIAQHGDQLTTEMFAA